VTTGGAGAAVAGTSVGGTSVGGADVALGSGVALGCEVPVAVAIASVAAGDGVSPELDSEAPEQADPTTTTLRTKTMLANLRA
jgi:hypothetical protein